MISVSLSLAVVAVVQVLPAPGLEYFPGSYFNATARSALERHALTVWPGPSGLLALWRSGALAEDEQVAVLVGGAAFHDPLLLPAYMEGIVSRSERVRQAAAYGYRDLLADSLLAPGEVVDLAAALALRREMESVAVTLSRRSLVELWLAALLENEGRRLPGWSGVVLKRASLACARALDRLLAPEDIDLLVTAWQLVEGPEQRAPLITFLEGLALEKFLLRQRGPRETRGVGDYYDAVRRVGAWSEAHCSADYSITPAARLAAFGGGRVDPMSASACLAWEQVLARGEPVWWTSAARQLYRCGAPPLELSMLRDETQQVRDRRAYLLTWLQVEVGPTPARR